MGRIRCRAFAPHGQWLANLGELCQVAAMRRFLPTLVFLLLCCLWAPAAGAMRIGVVVPSMQDLFWITYLSFMERGAKELGITLVERDARNEPLGLLGHAQGLVDSGVDGLIFTPCCGVGPEVVRMADRAGVPVIATLEPMPEIPPGSLQHYPVWVGGDYAAMAARTLELLVARAPRAPDGSVQVAVAEPGLGVPGRLERLQGLEQALAGLSRAVVVHRLPPAEKGRRTGSPFASELAQTLERHPQLGAIWCADAPCAQQAVPLLRSLGREPGQEVLVAAMDLDAENVYGLRSGEVAVDAGGHWLAGGHALVLLHDLLQGREPLPGQERPFGLLTLTREELPAYENNYPQGLPAWDFSAVSRAHREGRPVVRDLRLHY